MSNEASSFRKEIKYMIPLQKALFIKDSLDRLLARDSYCTEGAYSVRSLYFESVNNIDFTEKLSGVDIRKKVRIRIYNSSASVCKLEIKQKKGDWQCKESFTISAEDVEKISCGNYEALKNYFHNAKNSIKAYNIMAQGRYKPAVLIEYDRFAYQYPLYHTRITLDKNIRSSESNLNIFSSRVNYVPILYEDVVLEIKHNGKLPGFISNTLERFNLTQSAYSKYCSGRKIYYDFNY